MADKEKLDIKDLEKRAYILIKKSLEDKKRLRDIEIKRKRGELMKQILVMLALGISIPAITIIAPGSPLALNYILKFIKKLKTDKRSFIRSVKALKKQRLIEIKTKGDKKIITISEEGRRKILSQSLDYIELPKKIKWDGYWRVIIFDIPNKFNQARKALTSTLRRLNCYQLQKSVYVYPFEIKDEIDFISALFNVYEYIIYIKAKEIEGEEIIYNHFKSLDIF